MNVRPNTIASNSVSGSLYKLASTEGEHILLRMAEIAEQFGADRIAEDARTVAERIAQGRFYVACVGQFKRGKSTVLDALIGDVILPTGVTPVTAIPTVVRYGENRAARVRFQAGEWNDIGVGEIAQYVAEDHNPENTKQVAAVEVFVPNPLLKTGMSLVDTPGLGSVFSGNTSATQAFVPHIDAAIVVIGADPPISGEEMALAQTVAENVEDILYVLNKADRVNQEERIAAIAFAKKVLESRLDRPINSIFEVSALEQVEGRGDPRDWPQFVQALEALVRESGASLAKGAAVRAAKRLGSDLRRVIEAERDALLSPVEESEKRISSLRETLKQAEQSLLDLGYLFTAEQQRLSKTFENRRSLFLASCIPAAHQALDARLSAIRERGGPAYRRHAMRTAQDVARDQLGPWLKSESTFAEQEYRRISNRFVDLANDFLQRTKSSDLPQFGALPDRMESEGLRTKSRFYFLGFQHVAAPASPFRNISDLLLGAFGACERINADVHDFLIHLLETNSSRARSDVEERVAQSRTRLEADVKRVLNDVSGVAERALTHSKAANLAGRDAIQKALAELDVAEHELRAMVENCHA